MTGSSFFKLRGGSGDSLPAEVSPVATEVWKLYQQLDRTQWWPAEKLRAFQLERLRSLVAHACEQVPYYRETFRKAGISAADLQSFDDVRRLPILTRRTYQDRFAEMSAENLPHGMHAADSMQTSGTSGVPIEVRRTNLVGLWWLALYLRDLEWCGMNPSGSIACIRSIKSPDPEVKRQVLAGTQVSDWHSLLRTLLPSGPSFVMEIQQDRERQWAWLREIAPDYLLSYPSNLDDLGKLLLERGEALPNLKVIQAIAESLSDETRQRIESAFGVPVKNLYSCSEAGYLASSCPEGHGLHVHAENVLLEVLDDNGQPCSTGETGRVVVTTLHNHIGPFLRYEILDEAVLGPEQCPCGRGLPLLSRVGGKQRPNFWLLDGRRKSSSGLVRETHKLEGLRQWQFIQRAQDRLLVRVVPGPGWTAEHPDRLRQLVAEFFEHPIQTDLEILERLERPPGGKLLDMINELERKPHSPPIAEIT